MDCYETPRRLGFELKKIDKLILRCLKSRMIENGHDEVTIMHGYILGYLYKNSDKSVCQRDIEKEFGITKSTVATILKLMEKKGYLTRLNSMKDGRLKKLMLTEAGIKTHLETIEIIDRIHTELENGITDDEKREFERILQKMENNINIMNKKEDIT